MGSKEPVKSKWQHLSAPVYRLYRAFIVIIECCGVEKHLGLSMTQVLDLSAITHLYKKYVGLQFVVVA